MDGLSARERAKVQHVLGSNPAALESLIFVYYPIDANPTDVRISLKAPEATPGGSHRTAGSTLSGVEA
jgi:hypothetical protein